MPILKTALAILALPAAAAGYVVVMGTTGACPTCASIVSSVTGGAASSETETVGAEPEAVATPATSAEPADSIIEATGMFAIPLMDLDGNAVTLAEHAGRPMLIEVWATWCGPCRKVRSIIKEHETELSNVATLVGVSVDQGGPAVVKSYLAKGDGPRMLEFMVTPQFRAAIAPLDTKNTIPKLVYVGADGRIANLSYGVNSPTFMLGLLRNLGSTGAG
jgi:thiol-disulfide isomerase/thioredoxin